MRLQPLVTLCFLFCYCFPIIAQTRIVSARTEKNYSDTTFQKLHISLSRNFKFPAAARRMGTEGIALFKFELKYNGEIKSVNPQNNLGEKYLSYFKDAMTKVPAKILVSITREGKDSIFILPVNFTMGSPLDSLNINVSGVILKTLIVRVISWQRRRIWTAHGDIVEPGTEGTYYDLKEAVANKSAVLGLSLVRKDLQEFPNIAQEMVAIKYIDFEDNSIKDIPAFIGELKELEEIYLYKNKIEKTPNSLSKLVKLRNLILSNNNLSSFPDITNLKNLEYLDLSNNKINKIPSEINTLTKLRFLYLDNNDIKSIPSEIYELPNLEKIYIQGNPLTEKDIKDLKSKFKHIELVW